MERDIMQRIMDAFFAGSQDTLVARMGITILEASAERVVGTMPVAGNTQPYGLLHGGASCVLAETLGSVGAALHAGEGRIAVGIEISATHHRPATRGLVTGVATRLHAGRTVATYEIVISDDHGHRVCTSRLTCLLSGRAPGPRAGHGAQGLTAEGEPAPGEGPRQAAARDESTGAGATGAGNARAGGGDS